MTTLPAGFTIDTQLSPDRVRVQWPGIPTSGQSAYSLLHFDGSFVDDAGLTWTLLGSPTTTASQSRFGGASGSFAPGQGIRSPAALNWTYSSVNDDGNWTMEFWIYLPSNVDTYQPVVAITQLATISPGAITLRISGGGAGINELYFADSATSGGPTGYTVPTGQWVHIAIVRERQFTRLYANGSIRQTISGFAGAGVNEAIWIGRHDPAFGAGAGFTGFIDEFRFVLGSALYTGATYTVPTAPFTYSGGPAASTLANLNFEAGDVNWLKGAGWEISTGGLVDTGSWSAKYSGIGQSSVFHEQAVPVTPGTTITATARVSKGNTRNDFAGGGISMLWLDESLEVVGIANGGTLVNSGGPEFQTSSITGTAPAGAAYVRLFFDATRDVKGRASDKVYVDNIAWNHTFALGGTGGGSTAPTGPKTFTFRVRDANGCTAVATRTISQA